MWAEVAKQGGLPAKKDEEEAKPKEAEPEEKPKVLAQEDSSPGGLPKDTEQQELLSAVAQMPADAVENLNNEIEKKEEQIEKKKEDMVQA